MPETDTKSWAVGDPCPGCGGDLKAVPAASDEQRTAAASKDANAWVPIPPTLDHAEPAQIAKFGALHRCACGYQSRVLPAARNRRSSSSSGD
jgi:hypothetical protein